MGIQNSKVDRSKFYFTDLLIGFYPDDYFKLNKSSLLMLNIELYNPAGSIFPIKMKVNNVSFDNDISDIFLGVTKSKNIDKYKNEIVNYQTSISVSPSRHYQEAGEDPTTYQLVYMLYFESLIVVEETSETNSDITLSIVSNIGSFISYALIISSILSTLITKFKIIDKSGWVDHEQHSCITYHFDQLNNGVNLQTNIQQE